MERRRYKRFLVSLEAELIIGSKRYKVEIENLSKYGACIITKPAKTTVEISPGTQVDLEFNHPSGETVHLNCEVKWSSIGSTLSNEFTNSVGLEIIDPPDIFTELVQIQC
ncbi:MAG: PilZ domain-containing protein [Candidatus Mariimomonas ferrooxydans]